MVDFVSAGLLRGGRLRIGAVPAFLPKGHFLALRGSHIVASGPWPPRFRLEILKPTRVYVPPRVYRQIKEVYR